MTENVTNGERVPVAFGDFVGLAGLVEVRGRFELAYRPNVRIASPQGAIDAPQVGTTITIGSRFFVVTARNSSDYVPGMVVLVLREGDFLSRISKD